MNDDTFGISTWPEECCVSGPDIKPLRSVRLCICIVKPCTDTLVEHVAVVGSDDVFGAWNVEKARMAEYTGADGWKLEAMMKHDSVFDFQLLIFRPVYSEGTGTRFTMWHRENFGTRRLFIGRKPLKVLLEYDTLPAKILEMENAPGEDMIVDQEDDSTWSRIAMYSPCFADDDDDVDGNNNRSVSYTVLKDPLVDTIQRTDVQKIIKETEKRFKRPQKPLRLKKKNKLDIDYILNKPLTNGTRELIKQHYKSEAEVEQTDTCNKVRGKTEVNDMGKVIYAVCVQHNEQEVDQRCTVETQENMKDVKMIIREMEDKLRASDESTDLVHCSSISRGSSSASVHSNSACFYCKSSRSFDSHSNSLCSSIDACRNCRVIETQSSNSLLESFVNCQIEENPVFTTKITKPFVVRFSPTPSPKLVPNHTSQMKITDWRTLEGHTQLSMDGKVSQQDKTSVKTRTDEVNKLIDAHVDSLPYTSEQTEKSDGRQDKEGDYCDENLNDRAKEPENESPDVENAVDKYLNIYLKSDICKSDRHISYQNRTNNISKMDRISDTKQGLDAQTPSLDNGVAESVRGPSGLKPSCVPCLESEKCAAKVTADKYGNPASVSAEETLIHINSVDHLVKDMGTNMNQMENKDSSTNNHATDIAPNNLLSTHSCKINNDVGSKAFPIQTPLAKTLDESCQTTVYKTKYMKDGGCQTTVEYVVDNPSSPVIYETSVDPAVPPSITTDSWGIYGLPIGLGVGLAAGAAIVSIMKNK